MKTVQIAGRPVGDGHPCFILAEAGCNHNQDLGLAKQLVDMAVTAGADAVKFQTYSAEGLYSRKTPMLAHFRELVQASDSATMFDLAKATELPPPFRPIVRAYCRERRIPYVSSAGAVEDVDVLEEFDVAAIKIASFEMTHFPLLRRVGETGRPVILSTGMSNLGDVERALNAIARGGSSPVVLLHCVSDYPAKLEQCNLRVMDTLKTAFGWPVGFSDHTEGIEVTKVAIAVGANLIEKHITVDQRLPGPDHAFSLTPEQLDTLVRARNEIEAMLGSPFKVCTPAEEVMRQAGRRSLCAAREIRRGERVTAEMIAVKRPGSGLPTELMDVLIGATAVRDVEADEPLAWDMFLAYGGR